MNTFKTAIGMLVLVSLMGCATQRNAVPVSPATPPPVELKRTPRFGDLNDLVHYLGTALAEQFPAAAAGNRPVIAVGDFVNVEGAVTQLGRILGDRLTPVVVNADRFTVIERKFVDKVVAEQERQLSPFADEETAVEFGKLLGAGAIVTGTVSELGEAFYVNARAVDVENGSLLSSVDAELVKTGQLAALYRAAIIEEARPAPPKILVFRAQGVGYPNPNNANASLARRMAARAAKLDAMRNLVEEIKGTRIQGQTTIADMMTQSDVITTRLDTSLRGARVVKEDQNPDGSVAVEMEVELPEDVIQMLYAQ
jgi:TolB-like protein